jgi:hypothetical protein
VSDGGVPADLANWVRNNFPHLRAIHESDDVIIEGDAQRLFVRWGPDATFWTSTRRDLLGFGGTKHDEEGLVRELAAFV